MCTSVRVKKHGSTVVDRDGKWTGMDDSEREPSCTSPNEVEIW